MLEMIKVILAIESQCQSFHLSTTIQWSWKTWLPGLESPMNSLIIKMSSRPCPFHQLLEPLKRLPLPWRVCVSRKSNVCYRKKKLRRLMTMRFQKSSFNPQINWQNKFSRLNQLLARCKWVTMFKVRPVRVAKVNQHPGSLNSQAPCRLGRFRMAFSRSSTLSLTLAVRSQRQTLSLRRCSTLTQIKQWTRRIMGCLSTFRSTKSHLMIVSCPPREELLFPCKRQKYPTRSLSWAISSHPRIRWLSSFPRWMPWNPIVVNHSNNTLIVSLSHRTTSKN